ncbi:MAG: TlpA family protein disulfide reductase [Sedimentisphaerales bacterium]|nr:TlpA family protein disulfide reductase [Sedimentisphaerales bacterium]
MTLKHIKAGLVVVVFCLAGVVAAQSGAQEPNAVPAARVTPQPVQVQVAPDTPPMPALRIGVPAPALKVAKWIKGAPVERFEPGKIYIVEFWATWCGPCKTSIPHLTELAHKYANKVTVIGVSMGERPAENTDEAIVALVETYVKEMGEKMDYHVAADGTEQTMANTWMTAAEQSGIPCAFIVGKDGKIAWIGHPMTMDDVLAQVVAGTFDVQAEVQRRETEWRNAQERAKLEAPIRAALTAQDDKAVIEAIDKAIAMQPEMEADLMPVKFRSLLRIDEPAAFAYLKTLLHSGSIDKNPYHAFNAALLVSRAADLTDPNYALVVTALEKADAIEQENPTILILYAEMLSKVGKLDQAIEVQQKAIEKGEPYVGTRLPQSWLDAQRAKLEEYKAKHD